MNPFFSRSVLGAAVFSAACAPALAQISPALAQSGAALSEVTITGNPLGSTELIVPATQLSGDALLLRQKSTLGETLDGLPGVASTYFGPNASRPIVRGLDGDRIRILQNSGASIDASGLSFDHAVPVDPLVVERVEVLRGPGALQYGGSAVGGVVNLIDHRIHGDPLFDANGGVTGRAALRYGGAERERGGSALLETGTDKFNLHIDAFKRRTDDTRVPVELECSKPGSATPARRICNSESESDGLAAGGTLLFDKGYLGVSTSSFNSVYGTVAEDEVTIDLKSRRTALEGEWRGLRGPFQSVKVQGSHTAYRHTEFEGPDAGTLFTNNGNDLRIEARQTPWGSLNGVVGLQLDRNRFGADGAEAFAPFSRTRQRALFAYEELTTGWGRLSLGGRLESVRVASLGNPDVDRFEVGGRSFNPRSLALGALVKLSPQWDFTANLASTERAPKDYELFANGPHIATAAYELGDSALRKEKSTNLDVGVAWKSGPNRFAVNVFANRFRNFIALESTGNLRSEEGELNPTGSDAFPEFVYQGVPARFRGLEASGSVRLLQSTSTVDLEVTGDLVRANNRATGQALPRIAPARVGAALVVASGPWSGRVGVTRAAGQDQVPPGEQATPGYTLFNAAVTYKVKAGPSNLRLFARLDNLTDRLAYSATSILTQTAPGKSPLAGRGLKVGVQAYF